VHARKKRVITWGFSKAAIKSYEDQVLSLIEKFCEKIGEGGSSRSSSSSGLSGARVTQPGWTAALDMAAWSNYLTTDVVAEVAFGCSWGLMDDGSRDRTVVGVLKGCTRRAGVNAQAPWLHSWRLDWLLMPRLVGVNLRAKLCARKIVRESLRKRGERMSLRERPGEKGAGIEREERDIFGRLLGATDPETGDGMERPELIAESAMLIIAGRFFQLHLPLFLLSSLSPPVLISPLRSQAPTRLPLLSPRPSSTSHAAPQPTTRRSTTSARHSHARRRSAPGPR
jgi:hypothetical protein